MMSVGANILLLPIPHFSPTSVDMSPLGSISEGWLTIGCMAIG